MSFRLPIENHASSFLSVSVLCNCSSIALEKKQGGCDTQFILRVPFFQEDVVPDVFLLSKALAIAVSVPHHHMHPFKN